MITVLLVERALKSATFILYKDGKEDLHTVIRCYSPFYGASISYGPTC